MDKKHRNLVAILVAVVMGVALFSAFSINLFHQTPEVVLPSLEPIPETPAPTGTGDQGFIRVEVDPGTVQAVVASLERPVSYSRTVTVETAGAGGAFGVTTAEVAVDGGWTRVTATLPDSRIAHSIIGQGTRYVWYGRESVWQEYPAAEQSADLAQRLPTYEDVLAADPAAIVEADYRESGGLPCIYVAVEEAGLGYLEAYWISVNTGLLVHAESSKGGQVFYRMSGYTVETPAGPGLVFSLPDGRVLHATDLPS